MGNGFFKTLPNSVLDILPVDKLTCIPEWFDSSNFVCNGSVFVLPLHGWDLCEANIGLVHTMNCDRLKTISVLGGPLAHFYRKLDTSKPAYFVLEYAEENKLLWTDWP